MGSWLWHDICSSGDIMQLSAVLQPCISDSMTRKVMAMSYVTASTNTAVPGCFACMPLGAEQQWPWVFQEGWMKSAL